MEELASSSSAADLGDQVRVRHDKLSRLRQRQVNPYINGVNPTHLAAQLHSTYDARSKEELEALGVSVAVSGRIMAIRDFGKAAFLRLQDRSEIIQLYLQKDRLGEAGFGLYKDLDLGDIVFSSGK